MKFLRVLVAVCLTGGFAMVQAEQAPSPTPAATGQGPGGRQGGGRAGGAADGKLIGGTLTPAKPDARGWGWQVKASINPATPRPF